MGAKSDWIAKAEYKAKPEDIDIDKAWASAKVWMNNVGVTTSSKPDAEKIRAAMAKTKKGMEFVALWDGKWVEIEAHVGGKKVDALVSQDLSEGGDQKKLRAGMVKLRQFGGVLVTDADLKTFDAKHPDPDLVEKHKARMDSLGREIKLLNIQIQRLQKDLKPKLEELQELQKKVKSLGG